MASASVSPLGATDQRQRRQGGAHAPELGVVVALPPDRGVGPDEGLLEAPAGRLGHEGLAQRVHRHPCRHLAAHMATHPVGHGKEVRRFERKVLVGSPHPAHVGGCTRVQLDHRVTSNTVEPAWSTSPLPSRCAWVMRSELTYVPLVEPRSSTHSWSLRR